MKRFQLRRRPRGVALLMVMIGLIVCTLLTAGFLSSQGTAIGIARNERDAEQCRFIAQSGIDLCFSLIRNKSTWRETMTPGMWLSSYPVGNGTVTVAATSADGAASFATDPTQAVVLRSTGTINNRTFTLTGTISPTGGGTVFRGGNFLQGSVVLGNNDLLTVALIDSYNSAVAAYNAISPGTNAMIATNSAAAGAITVKFPSTLKGSVTVGPNSVLSSVVNVVAGALGQLLGGPTSTAAATEIRTPGTVVAPNFAGIASSGPFIWSHGNTNIAPGVYDSFTLTNTSAQPTVTFATGAYQITHDMLVSTNTKMQVDAGANVVLLVNGNLTLSGSVTFKTPGSGSLTIYAGGPVTTTSTLINSAGTTSNMQILGLSTCSAINLNSSTTMYGAIYAPQASVALQTGTSKLFGAVVAHDLTVKNTSQLHYDQALQTLRIDNLTGGSAPPGTADYSYSVAGY